MVLTTSQLRAAWGPACKGTKVGLTEAYQRLDAIMKRYGYRPRSGVTGAYNCRAITGGTAYSLHAYGPGGYFYFWTGVRVSMAIAVDINWDTNPYGTRLITDMPRAMVDEIKALRTNNGKQVWGWGGDYRNNKDAMHYEIVCAPADIATGIRSGGTVTPPPATNKKDDKVYALVQRGKRDANNQLVPASDEWWWTDMMTYRYVDTADEAAFLVFVVRMSGGIAATAKDAIAPQLWPAEHIDSMQRTA